MLSIVVPARNEERQIEQCVRSLLGQNYPAFEVIVVDDRSEDETAAIVERIAHQDKRLRLIRGEPLPEGWVGKPWALAQGAARASGEWLLFTDADTTHEPDAEAAAVAYAKSRDVDVLSFLTDQVMSSPAERIFLPSILWTIGFATGSLAAVNDPQDSTALFNGQYILMSRSAHDAFGGHALVRAEIAEDYELARRLKADGRFRTELVEAPGLVRTRMYRSFGELWSGFVKNFALGARGRPLQAAAGIALFALIAPVTPLVVLGLLATHEWIGAAVLIAAAALAVAGAEFGMRQSRFPAGSALALPLGITLMIAIFLTSVVRHAIGGVTWRGRRY